MRADPDVRQLVPQEGQIPVGSGALWCREVGAGQPVIVLHGGPDFDCDYLLPELDALADGYRLIYFDQRGRGRSATGVQPEDVSLASDLGDIESVRDHFGLEAVALLGHSWGGLLALEYALRYPERASHLILMNTAFVRGTDRFAFQDFRQRHWPEAMARLRELASRPAFRDGDPAALADYYRVHFGMTIRGEDLLATVVARVIEGRSAASLLRSRAIEQRLLEDTWLAEGYDLLPALRQLQIPTLLIHGDADFIPLTCITPIAESIPGAELVVLPDCGHFAFLEQPEATRAAIDGLFQHNR